MTSIAVPSAARTPDRIGQATAIEQSRAVAEVQAAIVVAQQCPRDVASAVQQMRESCSQRALANRSFFRYSRGGSQITGASIHLARELARCWGNVQYGISEMRRDDDHGQSEMQAWAWDVQTNARTSTTFVVPHKRDTQSGARALTDMRDIYENNANAGARRVREMIFAILPAWFTEEAKDTCTRTLTDGGEKPLEQRIADAVSLFAQRGVSTDRIEQKLGRTKAQWTVYDVAQLAVIYSSINRGEVTIDEEFPPARVTVAEVQGAAQAKAPEPSPTAPAGEAAIPEHVDPPLTPSQLRKIHTLFGNAGVDRDDRLARTSQILGREVASTKDLSQDDAIRLLDVLEGQDREPAAREPEPANPDGVETEEPPGW